jgi:hypothetical protein
LSEAKNLGLSIWINEQRRSEMFRSAQNDRLSTK